MKTRIFGIDIMPDNDPDFDGQESWTILWIDPLDHAVRITQELNFGLKKPPVWHGFDIYRRLQNRPAEKTVRQYLNSDKAQSLLDRICSGHRQWPYGDVSKPDLNEDAQSALDDLLFDLEQLPANES